MEINKKNCRWNYVGTGATVEVPEATNDRAGLIAVLVERRQDYNCLLAQTLAQL